MSEQDAQDKHLTTKHLVDVDETIPDFYTPNYTMIENVKKEHVFSTLKTNHQKAQKKSKSL